MRVLPAASGVKCAPAVYAAGAQVGRWSLPVCWRIYRDLPMEQVKPTQGFIRRWEKIEQGGVGRMGLVMAAGRRVDQAGRGGGISSSGAHQFPTSYLIRLHGSTQTCAINWTGVGPGWPIATYPEETLISQSSFWDVAQAYQYKKWFMTLVNNSISKGEMACVGPRFPHPPCFKCLLKVSQYCTLWCTFSTASVVVAR